MIIAHQQFHVLGEVALVCGGRRYDDRARLERTMDELHREYDFALIVHGAARGADSLAERWARSRDIPYLGVPAAWIKDGQAAGPIRNRAMLELVKINLVIAFPGKSGTRDMIKKAKRQNIRVITPGWTL